MPEYLIAKSRFKNGNQENYAALIGFCMTNNHWCTTSGAPLMILELKVLMSLYQCCKILDGCECSGWISWGGGSASPAQMHSAKVTVQRAQLHSWPPSPARWWPPAKAHNMRLPYYAHADMQWHDTGKSCDMANTKFGWNRGYRHNII